MTKIKVETTGDFMLLDGTNGQVVEAYDSTEVELTAFIQNELVKGRLKQTGGDKVNLDEPQNPGSDVKPVADLDHIPDDLRTDRGAVVSNESGEIEPTEAELAEDRKSPMGGTRKPAAKK